MSAENRLVVLEVGLGLQNSIQIIVERVFTEEVGIFEQHFNDTIITKENLVTVVGHFLKPSGTDPLCHN